MADAENASTVGTAVDDLSLDQQQRQLQIIKARTMFEMVEDIDGGTRKILFLTTPQAELLSSTDSALEKMMDALEVPRTGPDSPKLVINLLMSLGFGNQLNDTYPPTESGPPVGAKRRVAPFLSPQEEAAAEERIDCFMTDVVIPLAARTNAIVIANAFTCNCILAASFMRMVALQKSKWGTKPPFSIIGMTAEMHRLYANPDMDSEWRRVKAQSRAWRMREPKLWEIMGTDPQVQKDFATFVPVHDLDPHSNIMILVDNINSKDKWCLKQKAFSELNSALVRYLSSTLPSVAMMTGSFWDGSNDCGLSVPIQLVQSRCPLLCIDIRRREKIEGATREELIQKAKEGFDEWRTKLLAVESGPKTDNFLRCNMAWFQEALRGDGDPNTAEAFFRKNVSKQGLVPLWRRIQSAKSESRTGISTVGTTDFQSATREQISEVSHFLADCLFQDYFRASTGTQAGETSHNLQHAWGPPVDPSLGDTHDVVFRQQIKRWSSQIRTLLSSEHFSVMNLNGPMEMAESLVREIVRLDRLPGKTSLEGLSLVQEAWCEYDVAMYLANRYKLISKLLFALQLIIGWAVVVVGTSSSKPQLFTRWEHWKDVLFALTVSATLIMSIDALFNAKARWRQLRSAAGSLEGIIFLYRTRVEPFDSKIEGDPEAQLRDALVRWREDLIASGDLQLSALMKTYPAHVYRHHQHPSRSEERAVSNLSRGEGEVTEEEEGGDVENARHGKHASAGVHGEMWDEKDDFYSPMPPERYIEIRLEETLSFYRRRIPKYARSRNILKLTLFVLSAAASALSAYNEPVWALVVTTAAACFTSWSEFSDIASKTQRYTQAIVQLVNLLSFWKSLPEVDRASVNTIKHLVQRGEGIISDERVAWVSTASKHGAKEDPNSNGSGSNEDVKGHHGHHSGTHHGRDRSQ